MLNERGTIVLGLKRRNKMYIRNQEAQYIEQAGRSG
jgi:hypothetical protein